MERMDTIEPDAFDVIVVGSGLPEALLACAAAKDGRSVLLLDSDEFYGGTWSSVSWDTFQLILASSDAAEPAPGASSPTTAGAAGARSEAPASCLHPLARPFRILSRQTLTSDHGLQHECKYFIVDLNPKVLYQGEQLVNAMVKCNVHNYLEFKMIEGSFIHQQGALKPVPASKSDVFKTRDLTLLEKRSLMQLLNSAVAPAAAAPSMTAPTTTTGILPDPQAPLADLLAAAKLPPRLNDAVLYGIAMADAPQPPQATAVGPVSAAAESAAAESAAGQEGPTAAASSAGLAGRATAAPAAPAAASGSEQEARGAAAAGAEGAGRVGAGAAMVSGQAGQHAGRQAAAAEDAGRAAVRLYMESLGKYGGKGAFMTPLYGCGSIVEGFIRAAAVAGAVTVLRHPLKGLEVQAGGADGPAGRLCTGLLTSTGQRLQCKQLVASASALRSILPASDTPSSTTPNPGQVVSRAVAILDGPLQPGLPSTTVVFPPTDACPSPVRALQLGSHTCVTQAGRFLLYLVTPAASDSAAGDLLPALSALASTDHLRTPGEPALASNDTVPSSSAASGADGTAAAVAPAGTSEAPVQRHQQPQRTDSTDAGATPTASSAEEAEGSTGTAQAGTAATASAAGKEPAGSAAQARPSAGQAGPGVPAGAPLPKVLHVEFYQQELLDAQALESCLPENVVCCSDPDSFMMGFVAASQACQATFRRHFPGVRWVNDAHEAAEAQPPLDDDEALALEDLSSAVKEISAAQEGSAVNQDSEAGEQPVPGKEPAAGDAGQADGGAGAA